MITWTRLFYLIAYHSLIVGLPCFKQMASLFIQVQSVERKLKRIEFSYMASLNWKKKKGYKVFIPEGHVSS